MSLKSNKYIDKLKDPRWQKKRLEVMQRDKFECQRCGDTESTLNIHHKYYEKGKEPWEYESESLITLCESCHEIERDEFLTEIDILVKFLKQNFISRDVSNISIGLQWIQYKGIDLAPLFWMITSLDESDLSEIYNLVYKLKKDKTEFIHQEAIENKTEQ